MNVEIGKIIGAVGIKGHLKMATSLSNRQNISKMNSVFFEEEKNLVKLNFIREHKGNVIISLKHIKSRNEAESLIGKKLFIKRESLPTLKEGEYYVSDLIGFDVINNIGNKIGIVKDIKVHKRICMEYHNWFTEYCKMQVLEIIPSPIKGSKGNFEFLIYVRM